MNTGFYDKGLRVKFVDFYSLADCSSTESISVKGVYLVAMLYFEKCYNDQLNYENITNCSVHNNI